MLQARSITKKRRGGGRGAKKGFTIKVRSLSEVLRNDTVSSRARAFLSPLRGARDRIIFEEDREKRETRRPRETAVFEKRKKNEQHIRKGVLAQARHTRTRSTRAYLLNHGYFYSYCFIVI